jgi:hypothetical protein
MDDDYVNSLIEQAASVLDAAEELIKRDLGAEFTVRRIEG